MPIALTLSLLNPLPALAQERIDPEINAKIRNEGIKNSQIMRTMHFLTDVYGPRLTGSPNLKAAAEWAIKQMQAWGFENAHLEPWDFGHPGWLNERLTAHIVSPVKDHLTCEVLAWTPSTNGTVTAQVFQMIWPDNPTQEQLTAYLDSVKEKVKGKIVFAGRHQAVRVNLTPPLRRLVDQVVKSSFDPNNTNNDRSPAFARPQQQPPQPGRLSARQVGEQVDAFVVANGAVLRVDDAGREHGQIRAFNNRTFDLAKAVPTVIMRNEDYGRISRLLADGTPVELEFNIVNRTYAEGRTAYNTIGEIPGTDKK
jgi:hypothetical protein